MTKRKHERLTCELITMEPGLTVLAESVIDNSMVSSVGQEVGVEAEFTAGDYINQNWESGF